MLIVKLSSGIGNQLFIYCFAKYLEKFSKSTVYFEVSQFENDFSNRRFELDLIDDSLLYSDYKIRWLPWKKRGLIRYIYNFLFKYFSNVSVINEVDFNLFQVNFNPRCNKVYYFIGYWQSLKFIDIVNIKTSIFPLLNMPFQIQKYYFDILDDNVSIALHVRRGDYFNKEFVNIYGICDTSYYQNAVDLFERNNYNFYVFSEDPEWVSRNIFFGNSNVVYIPNFDINSFWYIYLMSKCKNLIMPNSTFSWWGGFLGENNRVITPFYWKKSQVNVINLDRWEVLNNVK